MKDHSESPNQPAQSKYQGEFTPNRAHDLVKDVAELQDRPVEDYFTLLSEVATAQQQPGMAAAIDKVSKTSMGSLLRGSYEPVVVGRLPGQPDKTKPAEQWAREYVASALGHTFADLQRIAEYGGDNSIRETRTETIADLKIGGDLDKELFVTLARILAREPEGLEAAVPVPESVTQADQLSIIPGDPNNKAVTLDEQPDQIVRFQTTSVESTVPGYNFVMWRHNRSGHIHGDSSDMHKIYLEQNLPESQQFA